MREADSAAAALKILQADKAIDLLFTDVVMPGGITRADLVLEARKLRPGIKILLTSGFTEATAQNCGELELLSKLYWLQDLDQTIHRALGHA